MTKPIYDWDTDIVYLSDKLEVFFNDFFDRLINLKSATCNIFDI